MKASHRVIAAALVACVLLLVLSYTMRSWGGIALLALGAATFGWYRVQVARGEDAQQFFGDAGEETRLTGIQAGSSQMPLEQAMPTGTPAPPRDPQ